MRPHRSLPTVRLAVLACTLLLGGTLSACGDSGTAKEAGQDSTTPRTDSVPVAADLADQTFNSTEVQGHELVAGTTLRLGFEKGTMAVHSGCNTMSGAFDVTDGRLAWTTDATTTLMGCPDDLAHQDAWLNGLFRDGVEADLDGDELVLTAGHVVIRLTGTAGAALDDVLGHTWTLTSIIDADSVSSVPTTLGRTPTLEVDADGAASLDTGCNTGNTTVAVSGQRLTFSPIALTKMACPGDAGEVERAISTVLSGTTDATWDGTTLRVMSRNKGLEFTVEK